MPPSSAALPPPLRPWVAAAVLVLALYLGAVGAYHAAGGDRYWRVRLTELQGLAATGAPLVVAIGNSQFQYALDAPAEMAGRLAEAAPRAGVVWGAINRASLNEADMRMLLPEVLALRPTLLVIQYEALLDEQIRPRHFAWLPLVGRGRPVKNFRSWLHARLAGPEDAFDAELRGMDERDCAKATWRLDEAETRLWAPDLRRTESAVTGELDEPTLALLATARAATRVLVVDVPAPAYVPTWFRRGRLRWFAGVRRAAGVEAVPCPWTPTRSEMCDDMHYAPLGRARYSQWLAGQVAAVLPAGAAR